MSESSWPWWPPGFAPVRETVRRVHRHTPRRRREAAILLFAFRDLRRRSFREQEGYGLPDHVDPDDAPGCRGGDIEDHGRLPARDIDLERRKLAGRHRERVGGADLGGQDPGLAVARGK